MTTQETKARRDELQAELKESVRKVRKQLNRYDFIYYSIKVTSLILAALIAFEPVLEHYLHSQLFWAICGLMVLLLLLLELGLHPDEKRKEKLAYIGRTAKLFRSASLIDPDNPNALEKLDKINRRRG